MAAACVSSINTRGQHLLASTDAAETACIACSLCTLACPACVLRLAGAATAWGSYRIVLVYVHAAPRCIYCAACVDACPVSAIDERSELEVGGSDPPDRKCSGGQHAILLHSRMTESLDALRHPSARGFFASRASVSSSRAVSSRVSE